MTQTLRAVALFVGLHSLAGGATGIPAPAASEERLDSIQTVRIGLSGDPVKRRVRAKGGVVVRDPIHENPIWKDRFDPGVTFVSETSKIAIGEIYRVQVASFTSKELAEKKKEEIKALLPGEKVNLVYHPDRRAWRVRVGAFGSRAATAPLVRRLNDAGYNELWITAEEQDLGSRQRIRLVDDAWNDFLTPHDRVLIEPARHGELLRVGDSSYRGTLEARVGRSGRLQLINEVDVEEYLRGVVPNEMGPNVYPELEALKAQAVAARTYIVANLGQFQERGYDICDTPSCQVYKGAGSEHPITDEALEETRGIILTWEGEPINAMYTSTCGGHTEDGVLVFPEEKGPYLKGVPCYAEAETEIRTLVGTAFIEPVFLEDGTHLNEELHILEQLGLIGPEAFSRAYLVTSCTATEARSWTTYALGLLGKRAASDGPEGEDLRIHQLASYLGRSLGWEERMQLSLDDRDLPYLLAFKDWDAIPPPSRRPLITLVREGILAPFPDNTLRPNHVPSRGLVLRSLYRILEYYEALGRSRATYRGSDGDRLLLETRGNVSAFDLASNVALFRDYNGIQYPTRRLQITLGDRVLYRVALDSTIVYLKLIADHPGVSDDRYSPLYIWEERATREQLEERINARVHVGRLIDIEPTRRGVSGRVVELRVHGSRGKFYLRGFRIRTALGIRENLFTVDRTYNVDGRVATFIFNGKGWGHGVGLCQVGAYGMALRGESYESILRHYYGGAELTRVAGPDGVPSEGED